MKKFSLAFLAAFAITAIGCDPPPPPVVPEPVKVPEPPTPPPVVETLPAYAPTGEHADLKMGAAAGIDDKNALAKATETEAALDTAIADLKAKKKK